MASSSVSPSADTCETAITVPAEYVEDFRAAIVEELEFECGVAKDHRTTLNEARWRDESTDIPAADLQSTMRSLFETSSLLVDVDGDEIELRGDLLRQHARVLAETFESMASKVVGPRLVHALEVGPIDESWASDGVRPLIARLSWAVENAAGLHALAAAEREGK